jgi:hypothetical protein
MLKYYACKSRHVISRYAAIAAAAAAGIIAAVVLYGDIPYRMQDGNEITVTGRMGCLPHERGLFSGPETEECAFGFRGNTGEHYAISNLEEISQQEPALQDSVGTVRQFALTGTFTYGDFMNYDVVGLIEVDSVVSDID